MEPWLVMFRRTGEQGWRCGESAPLPRSSHGSVPAMRHVWLAFVVGSRLAPRVFLQVLRFSSLLKNQHLQIPI